MYIITVKSQFFRTSRGNGNWCEKLEVQKMEGGILITPKLHGFCFINTKKVTDNNIGFTNPAVSMAMYEPSD